MAIGNINSRTVESKAVATTFSGRGVWSPSCPSFPSFSLSYLFPFIIFPFASLSLPREAAQVNSARDLHAALQVPPPVFGTKRAENEMHFFLYFESKKRVWCLQMLFYFCWPKSDSWSKCFFSCFLRDSFLFFSVLIDYYDDHCQDERHDTYTAYRSRPPWDDDIFDDAFVFGCDTADGLGVELQLSELLGLPGWGKSQNPT